MTHIVELPKLVHIEFMKSRHKHHFLLLIVMLVLNLNYSQQCRESG